MQIITSNRAEGLFEELAAELSTPPQDPLRAETIVVPSPTLGRWLSHALVRRWGVCANTRMPFPDAFVRVAFADAAGTNVRRHSVHRWLIHRACSRPDEVDQYPAAPAGLEPRPTGSRSRRTVELSEGAAEGLGCRPRQRTISRRRLCEILLWSSLFTLRS